MFIYQRICNKLFEYNTGSTLHNGDVKQELVPPSHPEDNKETACPSR